MSLENDDLVGIAGDLADDWPEVQAHVVENEQKKAGLVNPEKPDQTVEPVRSEAVRLDDSGAEHNPEIHVSPPVKNKHGNWRKKGGRPKNLNGVPGKTPEKKPEPVESISPPPPEPEPPEINLPPEPEIDSAFEQPAAMPSADVQAVTVQATALFLGLNAMMFGQDGLPGAGEKEMIEEAIGTYFQTSGAPDIPPWAVLCITLGMYTGKRAMLERQRPKIVKWWQRLRGWFPWGKKNRIQQEERPPVDVGVSEPLQPEGEPEWHTS